MRATKVDKHLRATFKEWARRIIAHDRAARKYGQSQNTIGEIERALAHAFMIGREADARPLLEKTSTQKIVEWIEIPPRARDTLFSISSGLSKEDNEPVSAQVVLERFRDGNRTHWRIEGDNKYPETFSDGGVAPLVRLAVLGPIDESGTRVALTTLGVATCREFWKRWNANDPTLPLMGVRS